MMKKNEESIDTVKRKLNFSKTKKRFNQQLAKKVKLVIKK